MNSVICYWTSLCTTIKQLLCHADASVCIPAFHRRDSLVHIVRCAAFLLVSCLLFVQNAPAQVKTFPNPDPANASGLNLKSAVYKVSITQNGQTVESFVYSSKTNFEKPEQQTDFNHWTTFESAGSIEIIVTKLSGDIAAAKIYPARLNIIPNITSNQLRFSINKSAKLFIDIADMEEDPLFIFADAAEKNSPSKKDNHVIFFEAGKVHNIGLQYKVPNGSKVYIEGGAVVWGTFMCEDGNKKTTICGKGVITTRSDERKAGPANIPFSTIYAAKSDIVTEGITITDPIHFCIIGRGKVETSNVKLFAWYHQTDGWGGGDDSFIDDSFVKVFDDIVKLYNRNQKATNLVIYQQNNGAPFQLSWGGQSGQHCLAENIDIVKCFVTKNSPTSNSAVLNIRKGSDKQISDITIRSLRADQDIYQLIGFGNNKGGTVKNILLENISISGKQIQLSYLENSNNSRTENIQIKEVKLNNQCFTKADLVQTGVDDKQVTIDCHK